MKKNIAFVFAALMAVSSAARAAEVNFDGVPGGPAAFIDVAGLVSDLGGGKPHPGPQPGQPPHPGHPQPLPPPQHPGGPGVHPPVLPPLPPPPQEQYHFGGYRESCRTFTFTAQSPLNLNEELIMEEFGEECVSFHPGYPGHCRPSTKYHSRKVTINIGPRKLEPWETERLELCMKAPKQVEANISGMLYEYAVASRNDDGFFKRSTIFTLTPGPKKLSQPDGKEISIGYTGPAAAGGVSMQLADGRAEYFRGEKITFTAEVMRLPEITQNMPVEDLLNAFTKYNVTQVYDVAGLYDLKLMGESKPGKYMVTLKYFRTGPLSSGAEASIIGSFELK